MIVLTSDEWQVTITELFFATRNKWILQQVASDFLQRATSATGNNQILKRVTNEFLQRGTSVTSNERILQRVTSDFTTTNEWFYNQLLQWVMSEFCNE